METLQQMTGVCYDYAGMTPAEAQNMMDNVVAMTDLSEDEGSPRHGMLLDIKQNEIQRPSGLSGWIGPDEEHARS